MRTVALAMLVIACIGATPVCANDLSARESHALSQICLRCHAQPNVAAPLLGDADAWRPRVSQGLDVMLENTILGFGEMPPLGTCGYCTEAELRNLIEVISGIRNGDAEAAP